MRASETSVLLIKFEVEPDAAESDEAVTFLGGASRTHLQEWVPACGPVTLAAIR